jgi:hypothetical protein
MEKVLIIFRGLNYRFRGGPPPFNDKPYCINALDCINNWKEAIFKNLEKNNIQYDIGLVTYDSPILEELKEKLNPKYCLVDDFGSQCACFFEVMNLIKNLTNDYDRFIILRFDYQYRIRITEWPCWQDCGITLINKDCSWAGTKFCSDMVFLFDKEMHQNFENAVMNLPESYGKSSLDETVHPHGIGRYLHKNKISYNLMYEQYYGAMDHPLYSYVTFEENPDLDNPMTGMPILI